MSEEKAMSIEEYGARLYGFDQPLERERIALIGSVFDEFSRRRIRDLGPLAGKRCLDVGAGPGTVTAWLANECGVHGEVIGLDRDITLLEEADFPGVIAWQADIESGPPHTFPTSGFDLIHARLTICHLPGRERVLEQLVRWLNPGGWILISDVINTMQACAAGHALGNMTRAFDEALLQTLGSDLNYAKIYPAPLRDLGMVDIGMAADLPIIRSDQATGRFWQLTFEAMRAEILGTGIIDEAGFVTAISELTKAGSFAIGYALVSAWGRLAVD
jgi:SAM-dependent methyltransferase